MQEAGCFLPRSVWDRGHGISHLFDEGFLASRKTIDMLVSNYLLIEQMKS